MQNLKIVGCDHELNPGTLAEHTNNNGDRTDIEKFVLQFSVLVSFVVKRTMTVHLIHY